jgi:hypothetical protein
MESGRGDDTAPASAAAQRRDKLVQVDRIVMDGTAVEAAAGMPLGANSKLDRDPALRGALWDHGAAQARRYLALRQHVPALFGDLDGTLAGACACAAGQRPDGAGGALRPDGAARFGELLIDGATVHGIAPDVPDTPQALVAWRSAHTLVNGRPVRIEGQSELMVADAGWRLKDVRITAVVPKAQPAARPPAPARKPAGRPPVPVQPPSETRH